MSASSAVANRPSSMATPTLALTPRPSCMPSDGVHEALGGGVRALAVGAGEQHGELVAADAGDDVVGAQRVPQRGARRADHLVADVMAERVVDRLEVVEVDQHHRAGRAVVDHRARAGAGSRAG